jgi:Spy/CpxP family protein refolding chaperone
MTRGTRVGLAAAVAAAAGLATAAWAQTAAPGHDGRARARRVDRVASYLGLSDQQKESWRALRERQRDEMKPVLEEGRTLRDRLRTALQAEPQDPTTIGQAMIDLKAQRDKVKVRREAYRQQLRALLTPEQQQKLDALEAARALGRGSKGRMGRRGPGRRHGFAPVDSPVEEG